jgi:hypothetical protein
MTRGIPYLIHELVKLTFQNDLTFSMESISTEKGKNIIESADTYVKITIYESDEDNEDFAAKLDTLVDSLRTTPL